jgi:hypothetical protein
MTELISKQTLRKARFFLEQARTAENNFSSSNDQVAFSANVEAAIVNARSALDHLRNEMQRDKKITGYREWHKTEWTRLTGCSPVFSCFVDRRNFIVHQGPARTARNLRIESDISIHITESAHITVFKADGTIEHRQSPEPVERAKQQQKNEDVKTKTSQMYFFADPNWDTKSAIDYISDFIDECERFVLDAERHFL